MQPHVQVALRLKGRGQSARVGDTIQYVICKDSDNAKSVAQRAYHSDEVKKSDPPLLIDIDYYLNNQIYPPVGRLLRPIDGTDDARVASCLGLDPAKFRGVSITDRGQDDLYTTFQSQISDEERFKNADRLELHCSHCPETFICEKMVYRQVCHPGKPYVIYDSIG